MRQAERNPGQPQDHPVAVFFMATTLEQAVYTVAMPDEPSTGFEKTMRRLSDLCCTPDGNTPLFTIEMDQT